MVICGILVLSVIAGLLIRISLREPRSKSEQTSASMKLSVEFPKSPPLFEEPSTLKKAAPESLNVPALPISKPDLQAVSKEKFPPSAITPFFENINKAVEKVEKSLAPGNAPAQNISTTTSDGIILSLTEGQFHFLYPDYFIAGLIDAQTLFIKDYDPAYEVISKIETDAQVRFIEEKIVATLLATDMITKERAEQFITTIRFTLPELQLVDLKTYYKSLPFREFLNSILGKTESPQRAPKGLFSAGLLEKLTDALAHKAQAVPCGYCYSSPLCFQEGTATPGVSGAELVKFACYCTGCYSSLGCLSSCSGQAAIYDPSTGICGCGL